MRRKGMWFNFFFLFLTFLVLTSAMLVVSKKKTNLGWEVGERALVLADTSQKALKAGVYLDKAALFAAEQALYEYAASSGSECGRLKGVPLWNSPLGTCLPLEDKVFYPEYLRLFDRAFRIHLQGGVFEDSFEKLAYFRDDRLIVAGRSESLKTIRLSDDMGKALQTSDLIGFDAMPIGTGLRVDLDLSESDSPKKKSGMREYRKLAKTGGDWYWIDGMDAAVIANKLAIEGIDVGGMLVSADTLFDAVVPEEVWEKVIAADSVSFIREGDIQDALDIQEKRMTIGSYSFRPSFKAQVRLNKDVLEAVENEAKRLLVRCSDSGIPLKECLDAEVNEAWRYGSACGFDDVSEIVVFCVHLGLTTFKEDMVEETILNFALDFDAGLVDSSKDACVDVERGFRYSSGECRVDGFSSQFCSCDSEGCSWVIDCRGFDRIAGTADDCGCVGAEVCSSSGFCELSSVSCPDGTLSGLCSDAQGWYCGPDGSFIQDCRNCPCDNGFYCLPDGRSCAREASCTASGLVVESGTCRSDVAGEERDGYACKDGAFVGDTDCCPESKVWSGTGCVDAPDISLEGLKVVIDTDSSDPEVMVLAGRVRDLFLSLGADVVMTRSSASLPPVSGNQINTQGAAYVVMIERGDKGLIEYHDLGRFIARDYLGPLLGYPVAGNVGGKLLEVRPTAIRITYDDFDQEKTRDAFSRYMQERDLSLVSFGWDPADDNRRPSADAKYKDIYLADIWDVGKRADVNYRILLGIIGAESNFQTRYFNVKEDRRAHGAMQLFPLASLEAFMELTKYTEYKWMREPHFLTPEYDDPAYDRYVNMGRLSEDQKLMVRHAYRFYDEFLTSHDRDHIRMQVYAGALYLKIVKKYLRNTENTLAVIQAYHDGVGFVDKDDGTSTLCLKQPGTRSCEDSQRYYSRVNHRQQEVISVG